MYQRIPTMTNVIAAASAPTRFATVKGSDDPGRCCGAIGGNLGGAAGEPRDSLRRGDSGALNGGGGGGGGGGTAAVVPAPPMLTCSVPHPGQDRASG